MGTASATACDAGLTIDPSDPVGAAAAMGICASVAEEGYSLISAEYTRADGSPIAVNEQIGVLGAFGPNVAPREGEFLLALSSGRARTPTDPGACGTNGCAGLGAGIAPIGFPQASHVAFDAQSNPVSVNADFLDVCTGCALGTEELAGTGFDIWGGSPAGATGWLRTTVPVEGRQEITLRFIIWDTGDQVLDSTVLLDGFEWLLETVETVTGS